MKTFEELVTARKDWINNLLKPWCQQARRAELLKADVEWLDIAGKVAADKTLWPWAWSRFPDLVHENLGIEETSQVEILLQDGRKFRGFPDARQSIRGHLVLLGHDDIAHRMTEIGPFSIDEIESVGRLTE